MSESDLEKEEIKYSLLNIMGEMGITNAKKFHGVMITLLTICVIPSEFTELVMKGTFRFTEISNVVIDHYESTYKLEVEYKADNLVWNDHGIIIFPFGKSKIVISNVDFVKTKMAGVKELLKPQYTGFAVC